MNEITTLRGVLDQMSLAVDAVSKETDDLVLDLVSRQAGGLRFALVNHARDLTDTSLRGMIAALQVQITRDVYPVWGLNARLDRYEPGQPIPSSRWVLSFFDTADQADALGYHDVTPAGLPLGKVFVRTSINAGAQVSVVASHELIEMLVDPWINVFIQDQDDTSKYWIREACDAVEADEDGYTVNGVRVSDFVTPAYFEPAMSLGGYDFRGLLTGPLPAMRSGGYLAYVKNGRWGQIFGASHRPIPGKPGGSNRVARREFGEPRRLSTYDMLMENPQTA